MKRPHLVWASGATLLAAAAAANAEPATVAKAASPPPSAGLVNDWLREPNDAWQAWDLGGQFRMRFEHREHMAIAGQAGAIDFRDHGAPYGNSYGLFRTKAHLGYRPADWIAAYAEGRDSFSVNDRRNPNLEADRFDLHQGYVSLGNPKEFPLTLKVGRQELSYGDERLVGAFDWNNIGRVFDAAKLRFENSDLWVDGFVGRLVVPHDGWFNVPNDYDWFWGGYASTRSLLDWQETQVFFLGRNASVQSPTAQSNVLTPLATPRDIYTPGIRIKSLPDKLHGWDYSAELAGQFGRFKESATGPSLEHAAFAAHAAVGYTFSRCDLKPRLGLEYDFSSGDSDPTDGKHGTFENLFPTNHKFYGFMDFLSWQNLHDVRLSASAKPAKGLTLNLDYHLFWLADTADYFYQVNGAPRTGAVAGSGAGYNRNAAYDSSLGSEIDLVATYAVKSWINLQAGYGHFFVGDYVEQSLSAPTHGAADADWVYVQASFNF